MKISIVGRLLKRGDHYVLPIAIGVGAGQRTHELVMPKDFDPDPTEPKEVEVFLPNRWVYRHRMIAVEYGENIDRGEIILRIKHAVLREENALKKIAKEIEAFENLEKLPCARRERIPDSVRLFVWQRDEGKCVKCGNREKLEFDHIIPFADGGSSTERNIQLLCEFCNRQKGKSVL